jgi:hypothetical protein
MHLWLVYLSPSTFYIDSFRSFSSALLRLSHQPDKRKSKCQDFDLPCNLEKKEMYICNLEKKGKDIPFYRVSTILSLWLLFPLFPSLSKSEGTRAWKTTHTIKCQGKWNGILSTP